MNDLERAINYLPPNLRSSLQAHFLELADTAAKTAATSPEDLLIRRAQGAYKAYTSAAKLFELRGGAEGSEATMFSPETLTRN